MESQVGMFRKRDYLAVENPPRLPCFHVSGAGAFSPRQGGSWPLLCASCGAWESVDKQIAFSPICDMDSCYRGCWFFVNYGPRAISELFVPEIFFW